MKFEIRRNAIPNFKKNWKEVFMKEKYDLEIVSTEVSNVTGTTKAAH